MDITVNIDINQKIVNANTQKTVALATGASETIAITPAVGQIGKLNSLLINCPPFGSSWGGHQIDIYIGADRVLAFGQEANTTKLAVQGFSPIGDPYFIAPDGTTFTMSEAAFAQLLSSIEFTNSMPLGIVYTNQSEDIQTNPRTYNIQYISKAETSF